VRGAKEQESGEWRVGVDGTRFAGCLASRGGRGVGQRGLKSVGVDASRGDSKRHDVLVAGQGS
jgi:hypothetical protein